jgi:hypothetical protein
MSITAIFNLVHFYSGDQSGKLQWFALCYYGKYSRTLVTDLEGR